MSDHGSEYGRLLAARDRLVADGVDPADLDVPLPPTTLAAVLVMPQGASAGPGLDVELLAAAMERHKSPCHVLDGVCDDECPSSIAAEYTRLAAARLPVTEEHGGFDEDQGWQERGSDE